MGYCCVASCVYRTTCSVQEMSSFQENVYTLAKSITSSLIHSLDKSYRVYKSIFFR